MLDSWRANESTPGEAGVSHVPARHVARTSVARRTYQRGVSHVPAWRVARTSVARRNGERTCGDHSIVEMAALCQWNLATGVVAALAEKVRRSQIRKEPSSAPEATR